MTDIFSPTLTVNLAAIVRNWKLLSSKMAKGSCASVVKADAYGLGACPVATALHAAGCKEFFVATLEEGMEVRKALGAGAVIYVFHGVRKGQCKDFLAHNLIPVLNDLQQIKCWDDVGPAALHIDTGMCRLGILPEEAPQVTGHKWQLILSHLACANDRSNPKNAEQLRLFQTALNHFPGVRASFANSSGVFLGSEYHFDLGRPGCSLYGVSPGSSDGNPVEQVVELSAPVLQYRVIDKPQTVGYSATASAEKGTVLATVEMGYADGFPRILSNKAYGFVGDIRVPLVGRVSMDMVSMDVTAVPEQLRTPNMRITFVGKHQKVDDIAKQAGTIGYEILTRMGVRVRRVYI